MCGDKMKKTPIIKVKPSLEWDPKSKVMKSRLNEPCPVCGSSAHTLCNKPMKPECDFCGEPASTKLLIFGCKMNVCPKHYEEYTKEDWW